MNRKVFNDLPGLCVFGMTPKLEGDLYSRVLEAEEFAKTIVSLLASTQTT